MILTQNKNHYSPLEDAKETIYYFETGKQREEHTYILAFLCEPFFSYLNDKIVDEVNLYGHILANE